MKIIFVFGIFLLCGELFSQVRLYGDTNFPARSMYIPGEKIETRLRAEGLRQGEQSELLVDVRDWQEQTLKSYRLPVEGDAGGVWRCVLPDLPNREWGFYRVYARLSNGVTLEKRGTRPAGFLTYAIVPDPDSRPVPAEGESVFGFHTSYISPWIGARTVMRYLHPTREQYEKTWVGQRKRLNDVYRGRPWVTYSHTAFRESCDPFSLWTREQREKYSKVVHPGIGARMFIGEEGERLYRQSVAKIAAFARFQMGNNQWMNYQPMWEPNIAFTPDEILRVHKAAFQTLRKVDPQGRVWGLTYANLNWDGAVLAHKRLFERGLLKYMDALSLHPYCAPPLTKRTFIQRLRALRNCIQQYAEGREIPVYATEFGISPPNNLTGDMLQLNHMIQQILILLGEHVSIIQPFYVYDLANRENKQEWTFGICYNLDTPVQSYPKAVSPKMWLPAYSFLTFLLEGFHSNGMISIPEKESTIIYRYGNRDNQCVIAAWDHAGNSVLRLPVGRTQIEVADVMGKRRRITCPEMVAEIPLSPTPLYLLGVSPELYGNQARQPIQPTSEPHAHPWGEPLRFTGKIFPPPGNGRLELQFTFPGESRIPAVRIPLDDKNLKQSSYSVKIPFKDTFRCGKYHASVSLLSDGNVLASEWLPVEISVPIRLEQLQTEYGADETSLKYLLRNDSNRRLQGTFTLQLGHLKQTFPLDLKTGESRKYELQLRGAEKPYTFLRTTMRLDFELKNKIRFSKRQDMNFLSARYLPGVGLNGDFTAWNSPVRLPLPGKPVRSPQYYNGDQDLSARAAFGWNEHFLLIDLEVDDDHFVQPYTGLKTWNGDSIQCGFAKAVELPPGVNELEYLMTQAYSEIDYALTTAGKEAYRTISFDRKNLPEGAISDKDAPFQIIRELLPDGRSRLHYRIALPWRFLNIAEPSAGMKVYWASTVNDRDDIKQKDVSAIGAFQLKHQAPQYFGSIQLVQ